MRSKLDKTTHLPLSALPIRNSPDNDHESGVDAATIEAVVDEFYAACRADPELGPIFAAHVHDWDEHLARIHAFWSSVLLRTGEYSGRPLESHLSIPSLGTRHFSTWLRLFRETVERRCTPRGAAIFMGFAGRMARNMIAAGAGRAPAP